MDKKALTIIFLLCLTTLALGQATITNSIGTSSRDYSTMTLWEDAVDGNLVGLNEIHKGECYDDSDFNETVTIDNSTTDATRYMRLSVASGNRHNGTAATGVVNARSANSDPHISLADPFTVIEWLIIYRTTGASSVPNSAIRFNANSCLVDKFIVHSFEGTSGGQRGMKILSSGAITGNEIRNTIIYDITGTTVASIGIDIQTTGAHTLTINNCTIDNIVSSSSTGYGIWNNDVNATVTIKNTTISTTTTADFNNAGTMNQSYNASEDATASGTGSLTSVTTANQFVSFTEGSEDLHLKTGANLIDAGNTVSGWAYDIDENSRPQGSEWEIGADEFVAVSAGQQKRRPVPKWWGMLEEAFFYGF